GKRALTGSADRTARLWDIETGKELRKISHKDGLTSVAFSQDGKRALTGSWDGAVSVCNLEKGNVTPFASEKGAVRSLAFLPDGKRGIAGGDVRDRETGWVEVFDLETGREASEKLVAPEGHVQSIAVSPDGRRVVVGSAHRGDGELRLQHLGGTSSLRLAGGEEVNAVAFLPDGERLLRASGTTLFLHDLSRHAKRPDEPTGSHRFGVSSLAVSKAGDRVVSAGADVKSWELSTGKETPLAGSRGPVALLGDGRLLSGSSRDPYGVRLADLATGDETLLAGHTGSLSAVAATPDGKRGLSVGWDGTLRVWDLEAKAEQRKVAAHEGVASALAVSPDGKLALTGGGGAHSDSQVKLWEIASGKLVRTLDLDETAGRDGVFSLAFSPDGKRGLVSGLALELWDVESGKCLWSLKRASGAGAAAVFSPDGKIVVEGGESAISLHDAETRKVLDRVDLTTSHDHLRALVFAPDGRSFFAGTARGVVLRFELSKRD
ncbi:hypothetical protein HY251_21190, partial [bacterium]|nr:hypothetical protein [bacterium]